ncbi:M48 family metalloprotease [Caulobacter radicis]|uniref:M48 family metalloprotease n=1 Tax=Caulobacter radicis TaxID=2172650 RepID=UPI000E3016E3|nr:M48 family metalloprotease [Caulobacter radicis]
MPVSSARRTALLVLAGLSLAAPGAALAQGKPSASAAKPAPGAAKPPAKPDIQLLDQEPEAPEPEAAGKGEPKTGKKDGKDKGKGKGKGLGLSIPIPFVAKPLKTPDVQVVRRFDDPAYPPIDPNAPSASPAGLLSAMASNGPVRVIWPMTRQVQATLVDQLIAAGPRQTQPAQLIILSDPVPNAIAIDNKIYMTSGLWDFLFALNAEDDTEAQQMLLFILAHEYGHLLMRHPQAMTAEERGYKDLKQAISTAGTVYLLAKGMTQDQKASYAEKQAEMRKAQGVMVGAHLAGMVVETEARRALYPPFRKETERDADMLAVDLAMGFQARTGKAVDIAQGARSLEFIREVTKRQIQRQAELSKASEKQIADAAKAIGLLAPFALASEDSDKAMKELGWLAALNISAFLMRKYDERRRLEGVALYDNVDQRQQLMKDYFARYHRAPAAEAAPPPPPVVAPPPPPEKAPPKPAAPAKGKGKGKGKGGAPAQPAAPKPEPFRGDPKKIFDFAAYRDVWEASKAREAALAKLAKGDVAGARTEIDKALDSPIKESPEVQDLAGRVASAENRPDVAIGHFRKVLLTRPKDVDLYLVIAERYMSKPDKAGAIKALNDGAKETGQPGRFLPSKITIYQRDGDKVQLEKAVAECVALNDADLTKICKERAYPPKIEDAVAEGAEDSEGGATGAVEAVTDTVRKVMRLPQPAKPAPAPAKKGS